METIELNVTGMTCGGCENAVKRALQQLPGVESVSASHAANRVGVTYDEGKVSRAQLREKIEALGYNVAA
jgi:copper chaperone